MRRIAEIVKLIPECELLADVGCDHGFVASGALKTGKAKRVIISDISEKSLRKAIEELKPYGGAVKAIVSDGFNGYDETPNVAVIAGMGGEEIVKILSEYAKFIETLVLLPHKNPEKVRSYANANGYKAEKDYTFKDGKKFYDIMLFSRGKGSLSPLEIKYGADNLKYRPADFIAKLQAQAAFRREILSTDIGETARAEMEKELLETEEIINGNL